MPPGLVTFPTLSNAEKTLYNIGGATISRPSALAAPKTIGEGISNPASYIGTSVAWGNAPYGNWTSRYDNLWNTNVIAAAGSEVLDLFVSKTVYDPSPIGFKIPNSYAFSGLTFSGTNVGSSASGTPPLANGDAPIEDVSTFSTLLGYYFYLDQTDYSKGTVFFPRTGSRWYPQGNLNGIGNWADHITATPVVGISWSGPNVLSFEYYTFGISYVGTISRNPRMQAFPARSISEE